MKPYCYLLSENAKHEELHSPCGVWRIRYVPDDYYEHKPLKPWKFLVPRKHFNRYSISNCKYSRNGKKEIVVVADSRDKANELANILTSRAPLRPSGFFFIDSPYKTHRTKGI